MIFNEESAKTVQTVKDRISQGEAVIDVSELCCNLALNIICETAMGVKIDGLGREAADNYRNNIYKAATVILYRLMNPCLMWKRYLRSWVIDAG